IVSAVFVVLRFVLYHLDHGLDVTDLEGEGEPGFVSFDLRGVVGHKHAVVADLTVYTGALQKVDVTFVWKCFTEIQTMSFNVAEMDVEDFLAQSEVADDVEDFFPWVIQHFANGALA